MKKNNKGFTLVELIVVIAILGVLMAVLVPQYIQYVEKSRISADESAVGEIIHAIEAALAEEDVYDSITATTQVLISDKKITHGTAEIDEAGTLTEATTDKLMIALAKVIKAPDLKSNTYSTKTYTIDITVGEDKIPKVTAYVDTKWS